MQQWKENQELDKSALEDSAAVMENLNVAKTPKDKKKQTKQKKNQRMSAEIIDDFHEYISSPKNYEKQQTEKFDLEISISDEEPE